MITGFMAVLLSLFAPLIKAATFCLNRNSYIQEKKHTIPIIFNEYAQCIYARLTKYYVTNFFLSLLRLILDTRFSAL